MIVVDVVFKESCLLRYVVYRLVDARYCIASKNAAVIEAGS